MYIATVVDGHWGIQSRFGTDTDVFWGNPEDDPVDRRFDADRNAAEAECVVRSAIAALGVDGPRAARYFHYPYLIVDPGVVTSVADAQALRRRLSSSAPVEDRVEALQVGATGVNVGFGVTVGERRVGGVCLVTLDGGRWGIKGSSSVVS